MAENEVSDNSSLQEFSPAEHDFAEMGENSILFTNYFSSKAAFRDNMMVPLEKMYQQDKEFVDYGKLMNLWHYSSFPFMET